MKGHLAGRAKLQSEVTKARSTSQAQAAFTKNIKQHLEHTVFRSLLRCLKGQNKVRPESLHLRCQTRKVEGTVVPETEVTRETRREERAERVRTTRAKVVEAKTKREK